MNKYLLFQTCNQAFSKYSKSIVVKEVGSLPSGSLVIPVHLNEDTVFLFVVAPRNPHFDLDIPEHLAILLQGLLCSALRGYRHQVEQRLAKLKGILLKRDECQLRQAMQVMKATMVRSLRSEILVVQQSADALSAAERQLADVSESCRCINAATGMLKRGLIEVWAQAARSLASMLTSHIAMDRPLALLGLAVTAVGGNEVN